MSNKLTLNLGLRYEYYPLMTRDSVARFDRLDFTTLNVLLGGLGGNPEHLGVTTSKKLFVPRVGLAYQVSDKMVVRTGFGITVDPLAPRQTAARFLSFTVGSNFHGVNSFAPAGSFSPLATVASRVDQFRLAFRPFAVLTSAAARFLCRPKLWSAVSARRVEARVYRIVELNR